MINNLAANRILWIITGVLALAVSAIGIFSPLIYYKIVAPALLPGAFSQDIMTVFASLLLIILSLSTRKNNVKKPVIIFGILGYLFYAYGIYVIERMYNMYYLVYIIIFTLAFWSLVYGISKIKHEYLKKPVLPKLIKNISATGSLIPPLIFIPLWTSMLLPLMRTGNQIDSLYSIFILDLCFIMPAFLILAYKTFCKEGIGLILSPAMFILGFTLIFSLSMGEIVKPLYNLPIKTPDLIQSLVLSLFFLILGILHISKLKLNN